MKISIRIRLLASLSSQLDIINSFYMWKLLRKISLYSLLFYQNILKWNILALQIELKGKCEPFQFTLDPPAILMPCQFYQNSTFRKGFRVIVPKFSYFSLVPGTKTVIVLFSVGIHRLNFFFRNKMIHYSNVLKMYPSKRLF